MGQIIPFKVENRYKGMSDDVRIQDFDSFFLSLHYDLFTNPKKATPYRNTEDNTTDGSNQVLKRFLYYTKLYALGRASSGSNVTKIYEKSSNPITDSWTASSSGADASGTTDPNCFIQYQGFLFGYANLTRIWAYNVGTPAFTATALNLTAYTNSTQGIVTGDDLLLMPYDNKIAVKDGGNDATSNWETARLTLPSGLKIVDIEEISDDYVAIITKPTTQHNGHSFMYIWDKVSADTSARIDLEEYDGEMVANIDGEVYVFMTKGVGSSLTFKSSIVVKRYAGGKMSEPVKEIKLDSTTVSFHTATTKIRSQSKVEVAVKCTIDGTTYYAMLMLGRKQAGYPVALTFSQKINNDSNPTTVDGAAKIGEYYFFAINSGTVIRTNNDDAYTATSIYISQRINGEERFQGAANYSKSLKIAGMTFPPLPAGGSIILYYRTDEDSSWTQLFTYTTTNGMVRQTSTNSDGTDIDKFYEIQFKVEQTGGTSSPAEWLTIEGEMEVGEADLSE